MEAQANSELSDRISSLESDVARHREESAKAQAEVDRLLEILRQMENEKNDKDRKINELERSAVSESDSIQPALTFLLNVAVKTFSYLRLL